MKFQEWSCKIELLQTLELIKLYAWYFSDQHIYLDTQVPTFGKCEQNVIFEWSLTLWTFIDRHRRTKPYAWLKRAGFPPRFSRACAGWWLKLRLCCTRHFADIFCFVIYIYIWWFTIEFLLVHTLILLMNQERSRKALCNTKFRSAALQICVDSIPIMLVTPVVACKLHSSPNGTGWYSVKPAWLTHRLVFYDGWDILKRWSHRIFVGRLHVWEIFWDHVHPCHVPI